MKNKCEKHPKYKGKKKPSYQCTKCLEIYLRLRTPRAPHKPTRVITPKKYKKEKHKKNYKEDL